LPVERRRFAKMLMRCLVLALVLLPIYGEKEKSYSRMNCPKSAFRLRT